MNVKIPGARGIRRAKGTGSCYYSKGKGQWVFIPPAVPGVGRSLVRGPRDASKIAGQLFEEQMRRKYGAPRSHDARETLRSILDDYAARPELTPNTRSHYGMLIKNNLADLGHKRLMDITEADIKATLAKARSKPRSALGVHRLLKTTFSDALAAQKISLNPMALVKPPKYARAAIRRAFRGFEVDMLLKLSDAQRLEMFIALALHTGMRPTEMFGLRLCDLDLAENELTVKNDLTATKESGFVPVLGPVKTLESRRTITLSLTISAMLRAHIKGQLASGFVFSSEKGHPIRHSNFVRNLWEPLLDAAAAEAAKLKPDYQFQHLGLYALRHTAIGLMRRQGMDVGAIRQRVGHASAVTTLNYYNDVPEELRRESAERMAFVAVR